MIDKNIDLSSPDSQGGGLMFSSTSQNLTIAAASTKLYEDEIFEISLPEKTSPQTTVYKKNKITDEKIDDFAKIQGKYPERIWSANEAKIVQTYEFISRIVEKSSVNLKEYSMLLLYKFNNDDS